LLVFKRDNEKEATAQTVTTTGTLEGGFDGDE